jgi:hypothetical protein
VVGLFSARSESPPRPPLPDRPDLHRALAGLDPADAEVLRSKDYYVRMLHGLPTATPVLAVMAAGIRQPTARGLLHVSTDQITFTTEHNGVSYLPAAAVVGAEVGSRHRLRVHYRPTVCGISITFVHEWFAKKPGDPEGLDFDIWGTEASMEFVCAQVRSMARG